jgi:hypothetical protein
MTAKEDEREKDLSPLVVHAVNWSPSALQFTTAYIAICLSLWPLPPMLMLSFGSGRLTFGKKKILNNSLSKDYAHGRITDAEPKYVRILSTTCPVASARVVVPLAPAAMSLSPSVL